MIEEEDNQFNAEQTIRVHNGCKGDCGSLSQNDSHCNGESIHGQDEQYYPAQVKHFKKGGCSQRYPNANPVKNYFAAEKDYVSN